MSILHKKIFINRINLYFVVFHLPTLNPLFEYIKIVCLNLDAAKRKQLPAWIREGLEKMEQERIKKAEKEKAEKEKAEKLAKAKLNSDTDLKDDVSNPVLVKSKFVSINYYDLCSSIC